RPTQNQLLGNKKLCRSIPGTSGQVHLAKHGPIPISSIGSWPFDVKAGSFSRFSQRSAPLAAAYLAV
ncbi:MAG: hypothetical protein NT154_46415, partial [Verrucomicrobia bacterium]|nr:hypothetical protein [Verrucomicrobiota bacterium]